MKPSYLKPTLLFLLVLFALGGTISATKERCHPHDKRALLRIKKQTYTGPTIFASWDPTTDCCNGNWSFIQCDDSTNRVNSFVMVNENTESSPIPFSLGDLPYLTTLIYRNNATGPIPNSLSKLRHLTFLALNLNHLTGPIPSFFITFQNLSILDLSDNLLTGNIPSSLALAPSLSVLQLYNNELTGPIPGSFGSLKNQQIDLWIANNKLSGEIPRSLEKVDFIRLNVSGNNLIGDASFLLGKDKTITTLDLSDNSFSFDMTDLRFPSMLSWLDIRHNEVYGSLPKGLTKLSQLSFFNVSYNRLCGRIPTGGSLTQFDQSSYVHNKCLCGTPLPPCN